MTAAKIPGLCLAILLGLQSLSAQTSRAETPAKPQFSEEVAKQRQIYESREADRPEGYVIGRSLLSYAYALASEFKSSLANLGAGDRWLDIGAGEGRAILDYVASKYEALLQRPDRNGEKARAVAMSIEDRRTSQWHQMAADLDPKQLQYLFGKRLREYTSEELGQFQVITDVMGGFSYSRELSVFMEKTLGFLALNGNFYTVLQDVRSEEGTNKPYYPNASFLTEIRNADGSDLKICSWLKSITCVEVTCELKADWTPPIERYRIRKTCNDVRVPAVVLTHFEAGTPPERKFQLTSSSSATTATATR